MFFKDSAIYEDELSFYQVCYVPENADEYGERTGYSHRDLLQLVHGDKKLCNQLFYSLDWQFPETLIDENFIDGLWEECPSCKKWFDSEDEKGKPQTQCPFCGIEIGEEMRYE